jgi:hypothetical protein
LNHNAGKFGNPIPSKTARSRQGWDSLQFVFVSEEGKESAIHGGAILKDAHGPGPEADFETGEPPPRASTARQRPKGAAAAIGLRRSRKE